MTTRFPNIKPDGSFSVIAFFECTKPEDCSIEKLVERFLNDWLSENDPWVFRWNCGATETVETCYFRESFQNVPSISVLADNHFTLSFEGVPKAVHWKNWLFRISKAVVTNCEFAERLVKYES